MTQASKLVTAYALGVETVITSMGLWYHSGDALAWGIIVLVFWLSAVGWIETEIGTRQTR